MSHKSRIRNVGGELIIPEFQLVSLMSMLPKFLRPLIASFIKFRKQYNMSTIVALPTIDDNVSLLYYICNIAK